MVNISTSSVHNFLEHYIIITRGSTVSLFSQLVIQIIVSLYSTSVVMKVTMRAVYWLILIMVKDLNIKEWI